MASRMPLRILTPASARAAGHATERQEERPVGRWDKQIEKQRAIVQEAVPEPIVAYGVLQPAGTWGSFGLRQLSPALATFRQHKANKSAGDLTGRHGLKMNSQTYVALTADKVYALEGKAKRYGIKIVGTLAEWRRSDVSVQLIPGRMSTKVVFDHTDGGHYELEATTMGGFNDPFLAELGTMARA